MLTVEVLIAAFRESILGVQGNLPPQAPNTTYLVIHQLGTERGTAPKDWEHAIERLKNRSDVRVEQHWEKGVSQNRNRALDSATADVCMICDDDVAIKDGFDNIIREAYQTTPNAGIITFQTLRDPFPKNYPQGGLKHSRRSLGRVSSVEITFRTELIRQAGLRFDTRFGLGADYGSGEEFLFLVSALKAGIELFYRPGILGAHPHLSSGAMYDSQLAMAKGALFARAFGWKYPMVNLWFALRKWSEYRQQMSLLQFLRAEFQGSKALMKHE